MNHSCDAPFNDLFFFHRRAYGLRHRLSTCRRYAADLRLSFYHLMAEALDYKTGRRYAADLRLSFYHPTAEALDYKTGRRYAAGFFPKQIMQAFSILNSPFSIIH
jgi:hypothetical protein